MTQSARKPRQPRKQRDRSELIKSIRLGLLKNLLAYQQHMKDVMRLWRDNKEIPRGNFVNVFSRLEDVGWVEATHENKTYFVYNDRRFMKFNFEIQRAWDRLA